MIHKVVTYRNGKCVYANQHDTAESAHKEYERNIKMVKKMPEAGVEKIVVRLVDGEIMAMETIKV